LHSTKIICQDCNTNKFGKKLDPALKRLFNAILLVLGLENANALHSTDPEGNQYLYSIKGSVKKVKPELKEVKKNGKTFISVSGDKKNAIKFFNKHVLKTLKKGLKPINFRAIETAENTPPLHLEYRFEITHAIILELNKIAIEFYAYSGLDMRNVEFLCERINLLDPTFAYGLCNSR
jgi:hypothetical protein